MKEWSVLDQCDELRGEAGFAFCFCFLSSAKCLGRVPAPPRANKTSRNDPQDHYVSSLKDDTPPAPLHTQEFNLLTPGTEQQRSPPHAPNLSSCLCSKTIQITVFHRESSAQMRLTHSCSFCNKDVICVNLLFEHSCLQTVSDSIKKNSAL